ncbi:MAG: substrate-binding domain-containing protein [Halanaerobiales bacterium]|nr:substrate-binding domain-containing protein [Halanaerobiales bacterium]
MKAVSAFKAIRELGLDVPKDIAVVGYNNYDTSKIIVPQSTTMNVPILNWE